MTTAGYSFPRNAVDVLLQTRRPDVPWRVVLRNAAAFGLPLALGFATDHPLAGLGIAAGALDIMFSDQPGPYRQRLALLLLASTAAGLSALLGASIGAAFLPMLLTTLVMGFGAGLLVVFGPDISRLGMTSVILLVVTAATPVSVRHAASGAGLIFLGGLLLTCLSIASWPLQRYRPERLALATIFRGLAGLAEHPADDSRDDVALSDEMNAVQQTLFGRHHDRGRAMEAFRTLIEQAERIRIELVAIELLHHDPVRETHYRRSIAAVLEAIAAALEAGAPPDQALQLLQSIRAEEQWLLAHEPAGLMVHIRALNSQLTAAVRNANWAGARGELRAQADQQRLPQDLRTDGVWATLRASLHLDSIALRHAIRYSLLLGLAVVASHVLAMPHGYWLPMTVAIVLRADFAATFRFGLLRVVGTLLGLVLTTLLLHVTPDETTAHVAMAIVLCMAFRYLATVHYGVAVATLTGVVVIMLDMAGIAPTAAIADRVDNTLLGSGMALLGYLLWPTWERTQTRHALAEMLRGYVAYLQGLGRQAESDAIRDLRIAVRIARGNARASLERLRSEPGTPEQLQTVCTGLLAQGNRLARALMTFEAIQQDHRLPTDATCWQSFIQWYASQLQALALAVEVGETFQLAPRPASADITGQAIGSLPVAATERLVETLDALIKTWNRGRSSAAADAGSPAP
ncbi:FUSC family protein [Frateuria aurantia]|uniref:Putative membrane protein n=1 Tax=Frateuria aurantia (strain ATCC 33424 / DSM 6220 / KCTC 2777 / LMG 1558 / NBRC 3245 / NCIMB 13370) TaxID=767434 RepID=H8L2R4_FRAAD|nr:FUSC family protein [Frateuria aurantia]AFC86423.1 putative membrane protein [Frateuria aurantia DSM 6220]